MIVGIDLGTTHSLIGAYTAQGPRLFPNALGDYLTPSVVSVDDEGHVIVGQAARDRLVSHPQRSMGSFKRWMGSARDTMLGERSFRPEELSAAVLRSLLADAEAALGERPSEAVISVPAYFSDAQRKATRAAGELAGIRVERLINEPTAAALAYGLQEKPDGSRFLVFDLGGGTFDVSILEMFEGVIEVHASAGDNFLGGEDFVDLLEAAFLADQGLDGKALDAQQCSQLRRRLELAKRELSGRGDAEVAITIDQRAYTWRIDEERFARLAEPLMQRMRTPLERAMRDARMQPEQLGEILVVGGASRMPLVARMIARMFGRLPLRHIHPDQAIAMGACVAAGMKARDQQLEEVILTDVCPYTLGISVGRRLENGSVQNGLYAPIIQRNSPVPVSREESYWPMHDNQTLLRIDIYQGESPMVENNIHLGRLDIPLRPKVHQDGQVNLRFTYDINGLLHVEATMQTTGEKHQLVLQQNPGLLSEEEIQQRLVALGSIKVHPRSKQENLALLARAERIYEEHLDARESLQTWIVQFRHVLNGQDELTIREHRRLLSQALDQVESRP